MLKSKLRKRLLQLRKKKYYENLNLKNKKTLIEIISKNKIIGAYYPVNFEMNLLNFLKELKKKKIKISLPVINKNNQMDFYLWSGNDLLTVNKFGIPEPEKIKKVIPNLILVPIVGFDREFYRLGYGGGYYDRYINKIEKKNKFIKKIGIAYSFQKIKKIPINQFDKKMDIIITDQYILK